ncbi:hypothetical protein DES43_12571 [Aquamicrobium defluvii]|uniref:Uncharacterized protein n=1 Tax=Aquamicrobium defluvii TaxID=69279 RepID=A0A4R6YBI0_9HYPH|nr:hypothetical protein DES43_12571 [Aquamicrobium defluvii]
MCRQVSPIVRFWAARIQCLILGFILLGLSFGQSSGAICTILAPWLNNRFAARKS